MSVIGRGIVDRALYLATKTFNFFYGTPTNVTIPLVSSAEYPFTVLQIDNLHTSSGTITASIQINGADVTGLASLSVTSTPQSATASASNKANIGDRVTLVLANNTAASNLEFTLKATL